MNLKSNQSNDLSSQERHDLYQENKHLKKQLRDLLDSVGSYRSTQHRFENYEVKLLECQTFKELINCLLLTISVDFKLDEVSLTLFDPDKIAHEMLGPDLPFTKQLNFIHEYSILCSPFKKLQSSGRSAGISPKLMRPILGAKPEYIELSGFTGSGVKSVAILPLHREQLLIGYICFGSYANDRFTPELAIELLSHLSVVIAVCLENTLSREQLHQLSQIDMLTRVKNRRAFDKALRREIARSQRDNLPLSCLFADLDYFKVINDTHGHATGDRTLKAVAISIQEILRETDVLARIGGEEFIVLLPNTEPNKARDIAERIRINIQHIEVLDDHEDIVKLTTSIGHTSWNSAIITDESIDDVHRRLMASADKAVYKAKQSGRNRVCGKQYSQLRDS